MKRNLTINFEFNDINKYTGDINYQSIIDNDFKNCIINIFLPLDSKINLSISALSHELFHLYELFQIKKIFKKTKWQHTTDLIDLEKMDLYKYNSIKYFKNLIYLSLPHEINARIASMHFYLLGFKSNDKEFLLNKLKTTKEYNYFNMLNNFDDNYYLDFLIKEIGLDSAINIFNFLNIILKIKYTISNINDLKKYFEKMKKYFMDLMKYYNKKITRILYDISNDAFEYIHQDRYILSFEEMIKEQKNTKKDKDIDYKLYFIQKSN